MSATEAGVSGKQNFVEVRAAAGSLGGSNRVSNAAALYSQRKNANAAAQRKRAEAKKAQSDTIPAADGITPGTSRGLYSSKSLDECKDGDMANASRDPYAAVNLLAACSGLGGNDPLFELKYCNLTAPQRAEQIKLANELLANNTKEIKDAQPRILKDYREASSEEQLSYVCACHGEKNFKEIGEYRLLSLAEMECLRYSAGSASDVERWGRITRAHTRVEEESGRPYSMVFNYMPQRGSGEALPPMTDHFHLIPEFVDTDSGTAWVCGICYASLRSNERPERCVATSDYGCLQRIGIPSLTVIETYCIP
jgi:hypothetical protein